MTEHQIVSRDQWLAARKALLIKEKEFTRLRDQLAEQVRELPWQRVEKDYVFDAPDGKQSLVDLFDGRSQLIVYHFMFAPDWDVACKACSLCADHYDPSIVHLNQRDVSLVTVSRAPLDNLLACKERMGWGFKWVSSLENDFNFDYQVSFTPEQLQSGTANYNYGSQNDFPLEELPGLSVFCRDADGAVYHTYSTYARGLDTFLGVYRLLDIVPKGRDEAGLAHSMAWVRRHDEYEA